MIDKKNERFTKSVCVDIFIYSFWTDSKFYSTNPIGSLCIKDSFVCMKNWFVCKDDSLQLEFVRMYNPTGTNLYLTNSIESLGVKSRGAVNVASF